VWVHSSSCKNWRNDFDFNVEIPRNIYDTISCVLVFVVFLPDTGMFYQYLCCYPIDFDGKKHSFLSGFKFTLMLEFSNICIFTNCNMQIYQVKYYKIVLPFYIALPLFIIKILFNLRLATLSLYSVPFLCCTPAECPLSWCWVIMWHDV
jgi:hypothetical protein